ncbi:MAG: hypothetical protein GY794_11855 [bacterium]|nr:hypothetical protein [bacterium]
MNCCKRDDVLRAVRFEKPQRIPMTFHINDACWGYYRQDALQELIASHPLLFPGFVPSPDRVEPDFDLNARAGEPYTDSWGCVWETSDSGITGTVTTHPLADWKAFDNFVAPDPNQTDGRFPIDWTAVSQGIKGASETGKLVCSSLPHGHTFMLLCGLRGFANVMYDMIDESPKLLELIAMIEQFNLAVVQHYIDAGVEYLGYPEDLGMQIGPMVSPEYLRTYIKPSYERLMAPARESECIVHMHSDGDIRTLLDDLIDGGVDVVNCQDTVNGIDWLAEKLAGRVCIEIDLDRASVTRFGTPEQIDALVRQEVEKLGSKEGGLMMIYGLYPGLPMENVQAVMDAMEKYATYYA